MQNDFFKDGALAVEDAEKIIPIVNRVIQDARKNNALIVYSADMHPKHTKHFDKWPPHCIAGTLGVMFHPDLDTSVDYMQVHTAIKGTSTEDDGYSAFDKTDLYDVLNRAGTKSVLICGLATDFCVFETAIDAVKQYATTVLLEACAAVDPTMTPDMKVLMRTQHVTVVD